MIADAAKTFELNPALLKAVIRHESGGDPHAVSPHGAKGLMQLLDSTSKLMGVIDPFNPIQNIMGGAKYLSQLISRFGGDLKKALASYNAGPAAVEKFDGIPPYAETRKYVQKILEAFEDGEKDN
jgi:soluble lytic murein transglycosylase-like protein